MSNPVDLFSSSTELKHAAWHGMAEAYIQRRRKPTLISNRSQELASSPEEPQYKTLRGVTISQLTISTKCVT